MAAVQNYPYALEHVKRQFESLCLCAVKGDKETIKYVDDEFKPILL